MENNTKKCSWIGNINIVKISIASKAIYRCNAIYMGQKDPKLPKQLIKSNKILYIMLSDFRLCHKTTVMKPAWY